VEQSKFFKFIDRYRSFGLIRMRQTLIRLLNVGLLVEPKSQTFREKRKNETRKRRSETSISTGKNEEKD